MDFGVGIPTTSQSVEGRAEGQVRSALRMPWFFDTQMITADCFVAMAAAAMKTSRIRLGTGVLVPSNRIAAVTANALADVEWIGARATSISVSAPGSRRGAQWGSAR